MESPVTPPSRKPFGIINPWNAAAARNTPTTVKIMECIENMCFQSMNSLWIICADRLDGNYSAKNQNEETMRAEESSG